ncbi:hypothetical protein PF005_g5238 [Phytophthora fragariae]|uniref:CID domain-containing protein n=2 Tax=Phytophthora fragariae TaxID=53985 RepID=A0A6A3TVQ8_9STRA|nr:hypothetical protein PF003_g35051 [Phytophthora fragariae]KAE8944642.1 hypothetical protein PF009_g5675 [Phytophthora fragariae]KAE9004513.1 hypothetical protein PF011_g12421 [Phytophthora fragariae]KAE9128489.1 hypothetical protein PF010_g4481 [Phytophthora fragariae]KAE9137715.1 hypothetical protein PF007_g1684 [Phytophthora fragariae]
MAMAQLASSTPSASASSGSASSSSASKTEIQALLGQFDAQINSMMDYPAKDTINALTMLAERSQFAPEVVSFLETKIHRVAPNCKLPIFYLTDSILKNVRGPYVPLFAAKIVPLYCNCVRQVSGKDLKRFIYVLNTWETTRMFSKEAIAQMRSAANRAMQQADPSARSAPASFNQEQATQQARTASASSSAKLAQQQEDMELRSLLTKLQNDMGIHPTEHMSLEEVRTNNPDYYSQLLEFRAASKIEPASTARGPGASSAPPQKARQQPPQQQQAPVARDPRRPSPSHDPRAGRARPPQQQQKSAAPPSQAPRPHASSTVRKSDDGSAAKSSNVAHLMQLLKRKQRAPTPPQVPVQEITNDPPRAPDAAAVMSILQKLKGMANGGAASGPSPPQAQQQQPQGDQQQQAPHSDNASRMWFSDKVVDHKDRVESNVQKLYAALPLVCRESGLRFREQAQLDAHLDFLFQYNRARKERGKGGVSRSWYPDEDQWVADFSGDTAPRESTSSSFFDRTQKENEKNAGEQASWEDARVPVDETTTRCRICGENFSKSWIEEEEDWMYTNAVAGTIHNTGPNGNEQQDTIFHKYCYETVMANSKQVTPAHLIPAERDVFMKGAGSDKSMNGSSSGLKRSLEEDDDSDSDGDDDVKRVKTD